MAAIYAILALRAAAWAYDLPPLNLGHTSFLDGTIPPTGPGLYGMQYLSIYEADKFVDSAGHNLSLPAEHLLSFAPVEQLLYVSPLKLFGVAHPGATVLLPVLAGASVDDGLNGAVLRANTGVGDATMGVFLTFDPIMGRDGPLLGQSLEFDVFVPIGHYNRQVAINPGSNYVSINPFYAATLWLTPNWTISGRFHYLWNATNDDPNEDLGPTVRTSQAGQAFHMNLAMLYQLNPTWGIGINGYFLQQITPTSINGQSMSGRGERVFGLGPGGIYTINPDYNVMLDTYREFGAINRSEGYRVVLRFNAHF